MEYKENIDWGSLRFVRESFGWTQEDLADELRVAVSTLSRWERKKTKAPLIAGLSRKTNRRFSYLDAMLDEDMTRAIRESDKFGALFHGEDLFTVAISQGTIRDYPLVRASLGFPIQGLLRGETKRVYYENKDKFDAAIRMGHTSAVWHAPIPRSKEPLGIVTHGKRLYINFLGQGLIHVEGRNLTEEDGSPDQGWIRFESNA